MPAVPETPNETTGAPIAVRWNLGYMQEHCDRCGGNTNHNTRWHDLYGPDKK